LALRNAGIGTCNIAEVNGILPPECKAIRRVKGLAELKPGQVIHGVLAAMSDHEPNRLVSAAIGWAWTPDRIQHGYISKYLSAGQTGKKAGDCAEDSAATMLASTLGIKFNPETAWQAREEIYKAAGQNIRTSRVFRSQKCDKNGLWTTVVAAAVFMS